MRAGSPVWRDWVPVPGGRDGVFNGLRMTHVTGPVSGCHREQERLGPTELLAGVRAGSLIHTVVCRKRPRRPYNRLRPKRIVPWCKAERLATTHEG